MRGHIAHYYPASAKQQEKLAQSFEQYVFGYSVLSPLIDDRDISDIRVVSYDNVRVKRLGKIWKFIYKIEREYEAIWDKE